MNYQTSYYNWKRSIFDCFITSNGAKKGFIYLVKENNRFCWFIFCSRKKCFSHPISYILVYIYIYTFSYTTAFFFILTSYLYWWPAAIYMQSKTRRKIKHFVASPQTLLLLHTCSKIWRTCNSRSCCWPQGND